MPTSTQSSIINDAAQAYFGMIPADCWHIPYMSKDYLRHEINSSVRVWGWEEGVNWSASWVFRTYKT